MLLLQIDRVLSDNGRLNPIGEHTRGPQKAQRRRIAHARNLEPNATNTLNPKPWTLNQNPKSHRRAHARIPHLEHPRGLTNLRMSVSVVFYCWMYDGEMAWSTLEYQIPYRLTRTVRNHTRNL